jgi:hypothetical protein
MMGAILKGWFDRLPAAVRHAATLVILGISLGWTAFGFNARLAAAEKKAGEVASAQERIVKIERDQAVMKQSVSDTQKNVDQLVIAVIGPEAVIHHTVPPAKPH